MIPHRSLYSLWLLGNTEPRFVQLGEQGFGGVAIATRNQRLDRLTFRCSLAFDLATRLVLDLFLSFAARLRARSFFRLVIRS